MKVTIKGIPEMVMEGELKEIAALQLELTEQQKKVLADRALVDALAYSTKAAKPSIGEHSIMGSSKKNLELTCSIMEGLLECLKGDKIRLVIEVADGTFVVNKYPME